MSRNYIFASSLLPKIREVSCLQKYFLLICFLSFSHYRKNEGSFTGPAPCNSYVPAGYFTSFEPESPPMYVSELHNILGWPFLWLELCDNSVVTWVNMLLPILRGLFSIYLCWLLLSTLEIISTQLFCSLLLKPFLKLYFKLLLIFAG